MKRVDIEALLQWAVNDELPKGQHVMQNVVRVIESAARTGKIGSLAALAKRHHFDDGGAVFEPGEPHRDALAIAKAVHRFDVCIGIADEAAARALLGPFADLDKLAVPAALAIRINVSALLLSCAVLKRRPLFRLDHPKPQAQFIADDHRRPMVLRLNVDNELVIAPPPAHGWNGNSRGEALYGAPRSPLVWTDPSLRTIAEQRAEYTIWWRAMMLLQTQLAGALRDHEALPPAAPAEPWHTPPAVHRILRDDGVKNCSSSRAGH